MGQLWTPLNIDKRERYYCWGKVGEFLFSGQPQCIFFHLLRLAVEFSTKGDEAAETSLRSTCFPKFSAEIVFSIFNAVKDAGDCFSLALTSKRCWLIGQPYMKAIILQHATSWAGDRIICVGGYTERGDFPKGLLSPEEEKAIDQQPSDEDSFTDRLDSYCGKILPQSGHEPDSILRKMMLDWHQLSSQDRDRLLSSIRVIHAETDILRNISKRQFVRRAALLEMRKTCPKHWEFDMVDLGHIVASRFCWSSDPSISMSYGGGIHRGVWAGDRFDITSMNALEEKDEHGQDIQWADVTDEVLEEMKSISSSEFGEEEPPEERHTMYTPPAPFLPHNYLMMWRSMPVVQSAEAQMNATQKP